MNANNNSGQPTGETNGRSSAVKRLFWSTLLLAFGLTIFLSAGFWQLDRAEQKRAFIDSFNDASQTPVLTAPVSAADAKTMLYRRFSLSGRYQPEKQVLIDNMVSNGEVGYQVLTPFALDNGQVVLVNRGWAKGSADRLQLPEVSVNGDARRISGRLAFLPAPGVRIDAPLPDPATVSWPLPMTWPTSAQISQMLGVSVLEWQLLLDSDQPDGYRRDWEPEIMSPETHLGYALQWFSFGALALIIYTFLNIRAARQQRAAAETTD